MADWCLTSKWTANQPATITSSTGIVCWETATPVKRGKNWRKKFGSLFAIAIPSNSLQSRRGSRRKLRTTRTTPANEENDNELEAAAPEEGRARVVSSKSARRASSGSHV